MIYIRETKGWKMPEDVMLGQFDASTRHEHYLINFNPNDKRARKKALKALTRQLDEKKIGLDYLIPLNLEKGFNARYI